MSLFTKWGWMVMAIGAFAPVSLLHAQTDATTSTYSGSTSITIAGTGTEILFDNPDESGSGNIFVAPDDAAGTVFGPAVPAAGTLTNGTGDTGGTLSVSGGTLGGAGVVSGGGVIQPSSGNLTLTGANTYTGGTTITGGTLQLDGGTVLSGTDGGTLAVNGDANDSGNLTISTGSTEGFELNSPGSGTLTIGNGDLSGLGTITFNFYNGSGGTTDSSGGYSVNIGSYSLDGGPFALTFTTPTTLSISALSMEVTGDFTPGSGDNLLMQLSGPTAGNYAQLNISGNATLQGTLQVKLTYNFISQMSVTDTFTLLNAAGTVTGTFSNVVDGGRITTVDGLGSFQVNYTTNGVVLSNFVASNSTVSMDGADVLVTFPSVNGRTYAVQRSTDLKTWNTVETDIVGDGTSMTITVPNGWQGGQSFYRVSTEVPSTD